MAKGGNPFFSKYTTPFGIPPFEQIKVEHYKPAFIKGIEEQKKEIEAIVNNKKPATFDNTIAALDRSGKLLNKVAGVFYGQNSANTSDALQAVSREISPLLSSHSDDIIMNAALFKRVKYVYDHQSEMKLDAEQKKLLEETYKDCVVVPTSTLTSRNSSANSMQRSLCCNSPSDRTCLPRPTHSVLCSTRKNSSPDCHPLS